MGVDCDADDLSLVTAVARGDEDALRHLVARHALWLVRDTIDHPPGWVGAADPAAPGSSVHARPTAPPSVAQR